MSDEDDSLSHDAFLNGCFRLWQPVSQGLRAGHDALLVAGAVPRNASGRAVDMGSGTGAVGFAAAARAPSLRVVLAERDADLARLQRRSIADAPAMFADRLNVVPLDLLTRRSDREAAGLEDGTYDWVLTNPPFHPASGRRSPDPKRAAALSLPDDAFPARWLTVAAALLRSGGRLVLLARPENLRSLLDASENRFGGIGILPIHSADKPAHRLLFGGTRGSRAPLRILPSFRLDAVARRRLSEGEDVAPLLAM